MTRKKKSQTITMKDLRKNLRQVVQRAKTGERIKVTAYGKPECQIIPPEESK